MVLIISPTFAFMVVPHFANKYETSNAQLKQMKMKKTTTNKNLNKNENVLMKNGIT